MPSRSCGWRGTTPTRVRTSRSGVRASSWTRSPPARPPPRTVCRTTRVRGARRDSSSPRPARRATRSTSRRRAARTCSRTPTSGCVAWRSTRTETTSSTSARSQTPSTPSRSVPAPSAKRGTSQSSPTSSCACLDAAWGGRCRRSTSRRIRISTATILGLSASVPISPSRCWTPSGCSDSATAPRAA